MSINISIILSYYNDLSHFESILNVVLCAPCYCRLYHFVKKCIHNYELYSFKCYILPNIINIMSRF